MAQKLLKMLTAKRVAASSLVCLGLYLFCCPILNEGLYQRLAVMPNHLPMDLLNSYEMGNYSGQHCFFPVVDNPGRVLNLHGVYFKAKENRGTVIFSLGNSGCLSSMLGGRQQLAILDMGYNLFVYDYEGFGESQGEANYRVLGRDGISAYNYVREKLKADKIILYGISMGAGVSAYVAQQKPVKGVVLDSPFISPEVTIKKWFPIMNIYPHAFFPEPRYDNQAYLMAKHPPTLIFTKGLDEVVGATQGLTLGSTALPPTQSFLLPQSAHAYISHNDNPVFLKQLKSFLVAMR